MFKVHAKGGQQSKMKHQTKPAGKEHCYGGSAHMDMNKTMRRMDRNYGKGRKQEPSEGY